MGTIIAIIGKAVANNLPTIIVGSCLALVSLLVVYISWIITGVKIVDHSAKNLSLMFNYYKNLDLEKSRFQLDKIKLIICDLDGTLLDHNGEVSLKTRRNLQLLQQHRPDLMIVPATGRGFLTTHGLLGKYLKSKYVICHNGSVLSSFQEFVPICERTIDLNFVQPLFDFTLKNDMHALVFSDNGENLIHNSCLATNSWFQSWVQQYKLSDERLSDKNHFYQCGVWVPIKKTALFQKFVANNLCIEMYYYKHPEFIYYEITGAGVNKQVMVEEICKREKILSSQVLAIGNGNNDIIMVSKNGIGVAVGNAEKSLLQVADIIIDPNYDDGVINFLSDLFLPVNAERIDYDS